MHVDEPLPLAIEFIYLLDRKSNWTDMLYIFFVFEVVSMSSIYVHFFTLLFCILLAPFHSSMQTFTHLSMWVHIFVWDLFGFFSSVDSFFSIFLLFAYCCNRIHSVFLPYMHTTTHTHRNSIVFCFELVLMPN